jgi:hypothetical protein
MLLPLGPTSGLLPAMPVKLMWSCGGARHVSKTGPGPREPPAHLHDHEVADLVRGIEPAARVGHNQRRDAKALHDADGQRRLPQRIPLVRVDAPLHGDDGLPAQLPEDKAARVPVHCPAACIPAPSINNQ